MTFRVTGLTIKIMKDETILIFAVLGVASLYLWSRNNVATAIPVVIASPPTTQAGGVLGQLGNDAGNLLNDIEGIGDGDLGN